MKLTQSLCVHSIADSSCNACVDICPHGAINLADGSLDLDLEKCDDCGLCVGTCPQHVLSNTWEKELEQTRSSQCYITCEFATIKGYGITITCIYSIHLDTLAKLFAHGIRCINLNSSECKTCIRYQENNNIDFINKLLEKKLSKSLLVNKVIIQKNTKTKINQPNLSRRSLFRPMQNLLEEAESLTENLNLDCTKDKMPFVPEIDELKCSACHACSKICPHQAITIKEQNDSIYYQITSQNCNGCQLCADICQDDAIKIFKHHKQLQTQVKLKARRCQQCKHTFFSIKSPQQAENICNVCYKMPKRKDRIQIIV